VNVCVQRTGARAHWAKSGTKQQRQCQFAGSRPRKSGKSEAGWRQGLCESVGVFSSQGPPRGAIDLVQEARGIFAAAGDGGALARDREKVLGNLYAVALAEMDRGAKMAKLLEMKKLNDLVKLKRQAEVFGIDWDAFKEVAGID